MSTNKIFVFGKSSHFNKTVEGLIKIPYYRRGSKEVFFGIFINTKCSPLVHEENNELDT